MATPADQPARKYHEKEEFVTGHSGTNPAEILLLCLVIPLGLHLYCKLQQHPYYAARRRRRGDDPVATPVATNRIIALECYIIEFVILVVPMLVVQTSLLPYLIGPTVLLVGMLVLALLLPSSPPTTTTTTAQTQNNKHPRPRIPSLSIHRACVYLLTTIAILAVDFPLFPRRFCKTEEVGYGWMDLGAASFIVIAGWTSALSSSPSSSFDARVDATGSKDTSQSGTTGDAGMALARKAIKKCTPLLLIGLVRLATNKGLEYQEHVSEYGVHWNFFFTLCCVEGLVVVWKALKKGRMLQRLHQLHHSGLGMLGIVTTTTTNSVLPLDGILALGMMIPYQFFLSSRGLQEFIENGDRTCSTKTALPFVVSYVPSLCNIFVANREGILGVVGYFSLRLLSEDIARVCLWPISTTSTRGEPNNERVFGIVSNPSMKHRLCIVSAVLWTAHLCLTIIFQIPNSRRSTNAPFVLWSLAHNTSLLCMIQHVMDRVPATTTPTLENNTQQQHTPRILEAVNRFGLAVFLSSNILTGLVNLTVDTLHSSNAKAMTVLSVYLALICGFALLLDRLFKKKKVD